MKRILYVAHDHLNLDHGVLKGIDKTNDVVVLVESARMTTGRPWHKERLFFLISSARRFARAEGACTSCARWFIGWHYLAQLFDQQELAGLTEMLKSQLGATQKLWQKLSDLGRGCLEHNPNQKHHSTQNQKLVILF